jgi:hypothetical protein
MKRRGTAPVFRVSLQHGETGAVLYAIDVQGKYSALQKADELRLQDPHKSCNIYVGGKLIYKARKGAQPEIRNVH